MRICVEIDLSKGLPDKILLNHEDFQRFHSLGYDNTTFRYRTCHQTGHLQVSCAQSSSFQRKKMGQSMKSKRWEPFDPTSLDEEEEEQEMDQHPGEEQKSKQDSTERHNFESKAPRR